MFAHRLADCRKVRYRRLGMVVDPDDRYVLRDAQTGSTYTAHRPERKLVGVSVAGGGWFAQAEELVHGVSSVLCAPTDARNEAFINLDRSVSERSEIGFGTSRRLDRLVWVGRLDHRNAAVTEHYQVVNGASARRQVIYVDVRVGGVLPTSGNNVDSHQLQPGVAARHRR